MKLFKNNKGFTLLEVLIAVAIIAILVSTGLLYLGKPIDESKVTAMQSEIAVLEMGIQSYKRDNPNVVINDIADLESSALIQTLIDNGYVSRKPVPHIVGKKFSYKKDSNGFQHVFYDYDDTRTLAVY